MKYSLNHDIKQDQDDPVKDNLSPISTLAIVVAEQDKINQIFQDSSDEFDFEDDGTFKIINWSGRKFYSDYIKAGIEYKKKQEKSEAPDPSVVMLFESPSSSTSESSFHNASKFRFHDWPPPKSTKSKGILGPCRYASMNGASYPVYLRDGIPPEGLLDHWESVIPGFVRPSFVPKIDTELDTVYAYLPVEQLKHHVNNPDGKQNQRSSII